jgi:DNA-binding NarL/FixJ family response regulator
VHLLRGPVIHKIIIADNHAVYLAGIANLLSTEDGNRIVAKCPDCAHLYQSVEKYADALVIVALSLKPDFAHLMELVNRNGGRALVIAENLESYTSYLSQGASGVVFRNATRSLFVDCVRRVSNGEIALPPEGAILDPEGKDFAGANARARLAPKELKIISLIVQGMKNKDIAGRLQTSEQVIKNCLSNIYDKTGVSDRLELGLFAIHHRILASAAEDAGRAMDFANPILPV